MMLYDPKWEVKTKPDPFKLATLIGWLETQEQAKEYDYYNCEGACLLDRYLIAHKLPWGNHHYTDLCNRTNWCRDVAAVHPRTYGAALQRARALAE
jgi:hypothetical protein